MLEFGGDPFGRGFRRVICAKSGLNVAVEFLGRQPDTIPVRLPDLVVGTPGCRNRDAFWRIEGGVPTGPVLHAVNCLTVVILVLGCNPVADKLLVAAALIWLVEAERAPAILALVIIGREIAIGALREWLAQHASVVHVSTIAKWKTATQMMAITLLLLNLPLYGIPTHEVGLVLLWIAVVLTLWSGYEYLRDAWPELIRRQEPASGEAGQDQP